ncbi:hypothetical protein O181_020167 [Austropuccinia psidii MF-1]|uniref:Uncharacterized protein n=1 Tax=Austropuccinia psidii MF-1 TaxID=1389203 RepID=A0A9Q3CCY9_9BASI|nr:hypothetical protein [Austropuccinia psidii MF-1]
MLTVTFSSVSIPDHLSIISVLNDPNQNLTTKAALLEKLSNWLQDPQVSSELQVLLLQDLSLDLPASLLNHLAHSIDLSDSTKPSAISSYRKCAQLCLDRIATEGTPKEVFMSLTNAMLQVFSKFNPPTYDDSSGPPLDLNLSTLSLARMVLPPLKAVLLAILTKSRNPSAFFNSFAQSLLCLFRSPQRFEPDLAQKVYLEILDTCRLLRSFHPALETPTLTFVTCMSYLLLGEHCNSFQLGKAYLCYRYPKWHLSLIRISNKSKNVNVLPSNSSDIFKHVQESIQPLINSLELSDGSLEVIHPKQLLSHKPPLSQDDIRNNCMKMSYGSLSADQLFRLVQLGAWLMYAMRQFTIVDEEKPLEHDDLGPLFNVTFEDGSSAAVDASIFLILSNPPRNPPDQMFINLSYLACRTNSESERLVVFRTLVVLLDALSDSHRLHILSILLESSFDLKIRIAIVNLLREKTFELGMQYWSAQMVERIMVGLLDVREDLRPDQVAIGSLKLITEKLNLVYLILKTDVVNSSGIKTGTLNWRLKELVITPIHQWIQDVNSSDQAGNFGSVMLALDLVVEALQQPR